MNDEKIFRVAVVAALCGLTSVLVVLLGAVGPPAAVGWLDYALLPALALFIGMMGYAMVCRGKGSPE